MARRFGWTLLQCVSRSCTREFTANPLFHFDERIAVSIEVADLHRGPIKQSSSCLGIVRVSKAFSTRSEGGSPAPLETDQPCLCVPPRSQVTCSRYCCTTSRPASSTAALYFSFFVTTYKLFATFLHVLTFPHEVFRCVNISTALRSNSSHFTLVKCKSFITFLHI